MADKKEAAAENQEAIEYYIHVFYHPKDVEEKGESERIETLTDMEKAFKLANSMAQEGDYQRVEVQKKYQEPASGRELDMTLKVFEKRAKKPMSVGMLAGIAVACGAIAFGATYFIAQMLAPPAG